MLKRYVCLGDKQVSMLLNDKEMFQEWIRDVKTMAGRIIEMREALYDQLVNKLKTPGDWKHITSQIGMFSFTGLNPDQCKKMVENAHIYMTGNGESLPLPTSFFCVAPFPVQAWEYEGETRLQFLIRSACADLFSGCRIIGRISMAGLNTNNVQYVAECIDKAVRGTL